MSIILPRQVNPKVRARLYTGEASASLPERDYRALPYYHHPSDRNRIP